MTGTKMSISEIRNETEFNIPRQVAFWNDAEMNYVGGIWVGKNIICGCCGCIFEVEDLIADAEEDGVVPLYVLPWVDLTEELLGDWEPDDGEGDENDG